MVCKIIDECRCYAYKGAGNPLTTQFCGVRRGPRVKRCPADCCAGGCPGQVKGVGPRQPFRIIDTKKTKKRKSEPEFDIIPLALVAVTLLFLIYAT